MLYSVKGTDYRKAPGQVETSDMKIISATPAFRWSIGLNIVDFIRKSGMKGYTVKILMDQTNRSKVLGTVHQDDQPSDHELLQRLGVM